MKEVDECFRILRLRIEDQRPTPSLIVVSAAHRGDGTTYAACGLARAFAEYRHRVLLLDANAQAPGVHGEVSGGETSTRLTTASLFDVDGSSHELRSVLADMRTAYDIIIVDAPPVPGSSAALELARAADGVLLAVKSGRRETVDDKETVRLLAGRRLLGVVTTRPQRRQATPVSETNLSPVTDLVRGFRMPVPELQR